MKKNGRYIYPAVFTCEPGQEIAVDFPDLDVATSGVNDNDALRSARELLSCTITGMKEDGMALPAPTPLADIRMRDNERAVLIEVYIPSARS